MSETYANKLTLHLEVFRINVAKKVAIITLELCSAMLVHKHSYRKIKGSR